MWASSSAQGNPDTGSSQSLANNGGHTLGKRKREVEQTVPQAELSAEAKVARAAPTDRVIEIFRKSNITEQETAEIESLVRQGIEVNKTTAKDERIQFMETVHADLQTLYTADKAQNIESLKKHMESYMTACGHEADSSLLVDFIHMCLESPGLIAPSNSNKPM